MTKVLVPIIGFGTQYDLVQFVYDLWLWSTVSSVKKSTTLHVRLAFGGKPYSLGHRRRNQAGLIDMQRQLGYPTLFVTIV